MKPRETRSWRSPMNAASYRIPARIGGYRITAELAGFTTVTRSRRDPAGRADRRARSADDGHRRRREHHRHRGSAAHQHHPVDTRFQHRREADVRATGPGPRLDVACADRSGQSDDDDGRRTGAGPRRRARVPVEHGRSAGHEPARAWRPAALQPRRDRRVPVHLEPVRRDAGPLDGRAGECRHALGDERLRRHRSLVTSATPSGAPRTRCSASRCRSRSSSGAAPFGGPIMRDRLHFFASYEYDRLPQIDDREHGISVVQHHARRARRARTSRRAVSTTRCRPRNRLMLKGNLTTFTSRLHAARQRPSGRVRRRRRTRPTTCRSSGRAC